MKTLEEVQWPSGRISEATREEFQENLLDKPHNELFLVKSLNKSLYKLQGEFYKTTPSWLSELTPVESPEGNSGDIFQLLEQKLLTEFQDTTMQNRTRLLKEISEKFLKEF